MSRQNPDKKEPFLMLSDEELDERLAKAQRADVTAPEARLDALLAEATAHQRTPRPRRSAAAIAIVGALIVGGATLPAAAEGLRTFLAQADFFPEAGGEVLPNSEWVDTSAPDFPDYLRATLSSDATLPPGMTRDELVERIIAQSTANPGLTQEIGLRRTYEMIAHCGWMAEWQRATRDADTDAVRLATAELQAATEWRALVATDGGGIMDLYRDVAEFAAAGDAEALSSSPLNRDCQTVGQDSR